MVGGPLPTNACPCRAPKGKVIPDLFGGGLNGLDLRLIIGCWFISTPVVTALCPTGVVSGRGSSLIIMPSSGTWAGALYAIPELEELDDTLLKGLDLVLDVSALVWSGALLALPSPLCQW